MTVSRLGSYELRRQRDHHPLLLTDRRLDRSFPPPRIHSSPDITYTLICGKIPISTELKCFREFDVENRTEGNAGMLTASLPLSVGH